MGWIRIVKIKVTGKVSKITSWYYMPVYSEQEPMPLYINSVRVSLDWRGKKKWETECTF